jgi:hypothetical protein
VVFLVSCPNASCACVFTLMPRVSFSIWRSEWALIPLAPTGTRALWNTFDLPDLQSGLWLTAYSFEWVLGATVGYCLICDHILLVYKFVHITNSFEFETNIFEFGHIDRCLWIS